MILNGLTCNFIPKIETKESATVKATEHKANPATNEVHLENRNHGLADHKVAITKQSKHC